MTAVNTRKVVGRRTLKFDSLDAIVAEIEALAKAKRVHSLGNWSAGQNLAHVALMMTRSMDGFPSKMPWIMRTVVRLVFKRRLLNQPMAPGFQAPKNAGIVPEPTSFEEGIRQLRGALLRLKAEKRRVPSPFLGELSVEEWDRLHCRHAELHLSFLVPEGE